MLIYLMVKFVKVQRLDECWIYLNAHQQFGSVELRKKKITHAAKYKASNISPRNVCLH